MRTVHLFALIVAVLLARPSSPLAWESDTTHAGIAEQAALASALHGRIEADIGISGGLLARLVVPAADAPELLELLSRFNPTHGFVPDSRGRQTALAWLAAGAALADSPTRFAANHFLDPDKRTGLDERTLDASIDRALHRLRAKRTGRSLIRTGSPAHTWLTSKENPLGLHGFQDQYGKALTARTPGESERHLAGALLAAGAMAHVLADMASPSHVRVDLAAHYDELGRAKTDVGSRLERIAALSYSRLGIGPAAEAVHKDRLESFFLAKDGTGLAQVVARNFVSRYTLPPPKRVPRSATQQDIDTAVRLALGREDITFQRGDAGYVVLDSHGTCVAHFAQRGRNLEFYLEDSCILSQLKRLLPLAVAYSTGLIDYLFRGRLSVALGDAVSVDSPLALGEGELTLLWDDASGVRTAFQTTQVSGSVHIDGVRLPSGAVRVTAVFRGTDSLGEPLIAVGSATSGAQ